MICELILGLGGFVGDLCVHMTLSSSLLGVYTNNSSLEIDNDGIDLIA